MSQHGKCITQQAPAFDMPDWRWNQPCCRRQSPVGTHLPDTPPVSAVCLFAAHAPNSTGGKGFGDPVTFDNTYYKSLQLKPWLNTKDPMADMIGLPSDHVLPDDAECRVLIDTYAADQALFFKDFTVAYQQLVNLGAVWV